MGLLVIFLLRPMAFVAKSKITGSTHNESSEHHSMIEVGCQNSEKRSGLMSEKRTK